MVRSHKMTFVIATLVALSAERAIAEEPAAGRQVAQEFVGADGSASLRYLLFLPKQYDGETRLPLMLFLHGSGERGDDLALVKKNGPPKLAEAKPDFPFIVVSPQCPKEERWTDEGRLEILTALVDDVAQRFAVDRERMYLTGLSMGGQGSWSLAAADPKKFAAVIPICSGGNPDDAKPLAQVHIWYFVGAKDKEKTVEQSKQTVAAIKEAGGDVRITIYPEAGHDAWTETYNNPAVYEWLLSHRAKSK